MNESPPALSPAHYAPARGRHLRSPSEFSPARPRSTDDLLSNLTPRTVVDALRNPSGTLQVCMDAASPAEQAFALRVAVASRSIYEWLEELSAWPWPAGGGSAGLETPAHMGESQSDPPHVGSLPAADVARYERRLDEIAQGLEELDIEEIKSQVLNNHIMPLSRPGTPVMDVSGHSFSSLSAITKLDDLAALITATTVQALPNLSRLARLMATWSFRLLVLRKIPVFLESLTDAEVALQSGWNAIGLGTNPNHTAGIPSGTTGTRSANLSREEFDVMRPILERKVAKAGRDLDAMLDFLEGQPDTLPESWIDRVDMLEHGYGEWTVACERKIKEADLTCLAPGLTPAGVVLSEQPLVQQGTTAAQAPNEGSSTRVIPPAGNSARDPTPRSEPPPPVIKIHPTTDNQDCEPDDEYPDTDNEFTQSISDQPNGANVPVISVAESVRGEGDRNEPLGAAAQSSGSDSDSDALDIQSVLRPRRASGASESSTVVHEVPSTFTDSFSSEELDHGTPERPRQRDGDIGHDVSGLSSFRSSTRSMSVSFCDKPTVAELPSFPSIPGTPTKSSISEEEVEEDDVIMEPGSPSEVSMPGPDDQLQQQISEILESVPAKIRLTAEPPAINLNPPDFKMPTARKSSRSDAIPRSQSSLSMRSAYSRSGTPSFTLAPAYSRTSRPRQRRGNQDIKLYHLSRSNGEAPIKLFIRCVGEHGERVMVRVGGGWADLGEYLKEYASHHLRRAAGAGADGKVEVKDVPRNGAVRADSTPPSRPVSAMDAHSPVSPLKLRKTRRPPAAPLLPASAAATGEEAAASATTAVAAPASATRPKTPVASSGRLDATPPSDASSRGSLARSLSRTRSRSSSRVSSYHWDHEGEEGSPPAAAEPTPPPPPLGMAGPRAKQIRMSEESRAWVESVKEKVRIASGERKAMPLPPPPTLAPPGSGPTSASTSVSALGPVSGSRPGSGSSSGSGSSTLGAGAEAETGNHNRHHSMNATATTTTTTNNNNNNNNNSAGLEASLMDRQGLTRFGEMGKVGSTKRLFRRG